MSEECRILILKARSDPEIYIFSAQYTSFYHNRETAIGKIIPMKNKIIL